MRLFAATEDHNDVNHIAALQELFGLHSSDLKVMFAGLKADADALNLAAGLFRPVFTLAPLLLVLELAKFHDFGNGRIGGRCDFNQVHAAAPSLGQGFLQFQDAQILSVIGDDAELPGSNILVGAVAFLDSRKCEN